MREDTLLHVSRRTEDTLKIHLCEDTRPGPNEEVYLHTKIHLGPNEDVYLHTKIHRGPNEDVYLEDTPEKMYNVVSLKRIVKCIFGYHSNFGQGDGPNRGACQSFVEPHGIQSASKAQSSAVGEAPPSPSLSPTQPAHHLSRTL